MASQETEWIITQENIPVGCVLPTCQLCMWWPPLGVIPPDIPTPWTYPLPYGRNLGPSIPPPQKGPGTMDTQTPWRRPGTEDTPTHPLWTEWLTDTCENITFPQLLLRTVKIAGSSQIIVWAFPLCSFFIAVLFWKKTILRNNRDQQTKECCIH